jgi:hypothetical protein
MLVASVVMVLFALVPYRFRHVRLALVIGWAAVWSDGAPSGDWVDVSGVFVIVGALGVLGFVFWREAPAAKSPHGDSN